MNSNDCVMDANLEYNVKTNLDLTQFNNCVLEYVDVPVTWDNLNVYNNTIQLFENNTMIPIYIPYGQYLNYNQISSQLMISLNLQSVNKNYIINFDQKTKKYFIKSNNVFSIKFNSILANLLSMSNEYLSTTIVESARQCDLIYFSNFINFDFLLPEILTNQNRFYNFMIPVKNINDNITNNFEYKQANQISKSYSNINNIKFSFIDNLNNKIYPKNFVILMSFC